MKTTILHNEIAKGPANGTAYSIFTADGMRLRTALWKSTNGQSGTVLLFPGRSDYIEQFALVAVDLTHFGFDTFAIDWRGQGLSDRLLLDAAKGHVTSFSDYQLDVAAMISAAEELHLSKPYFLLCHSMGGCIGLRSLIEGLPIAASAFIAPMWNIYLAPLERLAAKPASWAAQTLGLGHHYVPSVARTTYVLENSFEGNSLTNDAEMYDHWVKLAKNLPALQTAGPTMRWLYQALKETKKLSQLPSPDIPAIAFCGEQDRFVVNSAIQNRMNRWPNGSYELIKNAKHQILQEEQVVREAVIAKILKLFSNSLPATSNL